MMNLVILTTSAILLKYNKAQSENQKSLTHSEHYYSYIIPM